MERGKSTTLLLACLLVSITGCARHAPYHTLPATDDNCRAESPGSECTQSYYQQYEDYDLAFVEFSERGNVFSGDYQSDVLSSIRSKASEDGVVLVVFIHGWKHNADESDENLLDFKASLQTVSRQLKDRFGDNGLGKRRVIGLYVGWRGANLAVDYLDSITFWDRKSVAEEVGKGGITRLLLELDGITRSVDENVMVVIGHSFGGAIVVSALSEVLTERVVLRTARNEYARTIGDGILVLNPAIEATQALAFVEAAIENDYRPEQHPLFISLSSDADKATHYSFPLGQSVGLLLTWRQTDLARAYYYDRRSPDETMKLKEEHLDTTTVGNFAPFLTHRLTASEEDGSVSFEYRTCSDDPAGCEPAGLTSLSGQPAIRKLPENYPLFFIKTDDSLMDGHNDIFNGRVRGFVVAVIDDIVAYNLARTRAKREGVRFEPPVSILRQPDRLQQRLRELVQQPSQ